MQLLLCGCLLYIIQGFPYFCEASAASFAELMPMQIAQDKRNVYQFLKYTVREDSRINFVTRYVPWIFSEDPEPVYQETSEGCEFLKTMFLKISIF